MNGAKDSSRTSAQVTKAGAITAKIKLTVIGLAVVSLSLLGCTVAYYSGIARANGAGSRTMATAVYQSLTSGQAAPISVLCHHTCAAELRKEENRRGRPQWFRVRRVEARWPGLPVRVYLDVARRGEITKEVLVRNSMGPFDDWTVGQGER